MYLIKLFDVLWYVHVSVCRKHIKLYQISNDLYTKK